jgi:ATP phosphoribosyltransferase
MKTKEKKKEQRNYLELIPEIKCKWETDEKGKINLLIPRFKVQWVKKIAMKMGRPEFVNVHLDETGTRVWKLIDGKKTVAKIGEELKEQFESEGNGIKQHYERLTQFLSIMHRNKFVHFTNY